MENRPKPCPCCGNEATLGSWPSRKGWEASVECTNCLLIMRSITYDSSSEAEEHVLEDWNQRVD